MVICESYMFKFNTGKDVKKRYNKGGDCRESSDTIMSNTNCQRMALFFGWLVKTT